MIQDKREFEVELVVTTRHLITTFSRSPEEAERDAEDLYDDGEMGKVISYDIEQADAFAIGDELEEEGLEEPEND